MTTNIVLPEQLANEFCKVLNAWLDAETIQRINILNATNAPALCATHAYCDPNQAMLDAMEVCGLQFDTEHLGLINAAWSIAKARGFAVVAE